MKKIMSIIVMVFLMIMPYAFAAAYNEEVTTSSPMVELKNAQFLVKSLRYEPYPVNAGDWFDIWIKVENIGQPDAENAQFALELAYPFDEVEGELTEEYGIIPGTITTHQHIRPGEEEPEDNYVVIKYKVHIDENAQDGIYNLKFTTQTTANENTNQDSEFPITVAKTKTDFTLSLEHVSETTMTFSIVNTGENTAEGITVTMQNPDETEYTTVLGTLNIGEFTTISFPKVNTTFVEMNISYTDAGGVRTTKIETIPITLSSEEESNNYGVPPLTGYISLLNLFIGAIVGVILAYSAYMIIQRKK